MIRKTVLFGCFFFIAGISFAQQMSLGLRAGYTLSDVLIKEPDGDGNLYFQVDEHFRMLSSYHIGIDARQPVNGRVGMLASLLYAQKGYLGTLNWPGGPVDAAWQLHYLNLAMVADFLLWKGLSLQAGVEGGWLMDTRVKSDGATFDFQDIFRHINEYDFALVCGLEYRFNKGVFIGARHIFGIAPLQKYEVTDQTGTSLGYITSRNSATQISLGYRHLIGE